MSVEIDRSVIPINHSLKKIEKLTSKQIRIALTKRVAVNPKLIVNPDPDNLAQLGSSIKKLTNII